MLVVGLTGGIASGKSTIAEQFGLLGANIIDSDKLAREVVEPEKSALQQIVEHFGNTILLENGQLDRKQLAKLIFANPTERIWVENLLHPLIRELMRARVAQSTAPYCILVIPLLVESKPNPLIQRVLVVDASEETQKQRLLARDNISLEQINQILAAQTTREKRLAKADDIIHNNGSIDTVLPEIDRLHQQYLALAKGK